MNFCVTPLWHLPQVASRLAVLMVERASLEGRMLWTPWQLEQLLEKTVAPGPLLVACVAAPSAPGGPADVSAAAAGAARTVASGGDAGAGSRGNALELSVSVSPHVPLGSGGSTPCTRASC